MLPSTELQRLIDAADRECQDVVRNGGKMPASFLAFDAMRLYLYSTAPFRHLTPKNGANN